MAEKYRIILFGRYPFEAQWRPLIAASLMLAALVVSCVRYFWKPWLRALWAVVLTVFFVLMRGGVLGLAPVRTDLWGGLPLTLMLATLSIFMASPISVAVALGRRSTLPAIRSLCIVYVELIRGVQALPKGQLEAADTLGLSYWQTQRKIVLPEALTMVVPSMMNNFISIFKDTSLVTIVSLYELTGALALNSDGKWRPFKIKA